MFGFIRSLADKSHKVFGFVRSVADRSLQKSLDLFVLLLIEVHKEFGFVRSFADKSPQGVWNRSNASHYQTSLVMYPAFLSWAESSHQMHRL